MDQNVPASLNIDDKFYQSQLSKDLAINVYQNGQWGTYRHLKLDEANKVKAAHIYANVTVRGDLSSLSWMKGSISDKRYAIVTLYFSYYTYSCNDYEV